MKNKSEDELLSDEAHLAAKAGRFVTAKGLINRITDPEAKRKAIESYRVYVWHDEIATHECAHGRTPPPVTKKLWDHVRDQMEIEAQDEDEKEH